MAPQLAGIIDVGEMDKRQIALLSAAKRAVETVLAVPRYNGSDAIVDCILFEHPGKDGKHVAEGVEIIGKSAYFVVQVNRADGNIDYAAVGVDQDNIPVCLPCYFREQEILDWQTCSSKERESPTPRELVVTWNLEDPKTLSYKESEKVPHYDDNGLSNNSLTLTFVDFNAISGDPIKMSRAYTWLDITYDTALFN